jgi:7-cyano-7-deazaguanine synthase
VTVYVSLSGGLDSTCALAITPLTDVAAVSFDYGQRHRRELQAASAIAGRYGIAHRILDLRGLLHGSSLLGEQEVPEGHYAEETMRATVVQGRNLLFAAAAIATMRPGDGLVVGVHAGDHPIYPDCRPEFWQALDAVASSYQVEIAAPFVEISKAEVVQLGHQAGAPLELTWSCYQGGEFHCGRCGTCVERAEAFHLAGIPDPTEYADPEFWKAATA